jgi:ribosomal-protein-alanine N-acetyltransferase
MNMARHLFGVACFKAEFRIYLRILLQYKLRYLAMDSLCMLRQILEQDLPELIRVESACQIVPWSDEVFKKCLEAGSTGWVMELDGKMIGFILILYQLDEVHILNFCVHPDYQRQGWGMQLMTHMLQNLTNQSAKLVYLEVRRSNEHAIALYEKVGFSKVGERKDYYLSLEHREDALVFAKNL